MSLSSFLPLLIITSGMAFSFVFYMGRATLLPDIAIRRAQRAAPDLAFPPPRGEGI